MKLARDKIGRELQRCHQLCIDRTREAIKAAIRAGQLLTLVRAEIPEGEWESWLAAVGIGKTTAWRYTRVFQEANRNRKVKHMLNRGASLVDLYREFGLVKACEPGGYKSEAYQRRKAGEQLVFDFAYEECAPHLESLIKAENVEELGETTLHRLERDLTAALDRVRHIKARNSAITVEETES